MDIGPILNCLAKLYFTNLLYIDFPDIRGPISLPIRYLLGAQGPGTNSAKLEPKNTSSKQNWIDLFKMAGKG